MEKPDEEITAELKHQAQVFNILSYWLKKSLNKSRESVKRYIQVTRETLDKTKHRLDSLFKRKFEE